MYYGQFLIDKYLHQTFFNDKKRGFFVECGALDGKLESSCLFFEHSLSWTGMNIEAVPPLFKMLQKNRPNCININIALSNNNDEAIFKHAIHPKHGMLFGNGSLGHHESHMQDLLKQGCNFKEYKVQCKKFSQVFKNEVPIDLFVLDVEGHELQALEGILEIDDEFLPKIFCIEYTFSGLDNISNMLKKYKLHSTRQQNAIYVKNV